MHKHQWIVQSQAGCVQFSTIEIARKHAQLNRPATIWLASDVTETQGNCVSTPIGVKPIEVVW